MLIYDIHVVMGTAEPAEAPCVKRNDTGVSLRVFPEIATKLSKFREKREAYTIPAGATAVIKIAKADKTFVLQDGEVRPGFIYFELPPQAFTCCGAANAEVSIYDEDGRRVTTGTFVLNVAAECVSECTPDSKPYVDILGNLIEEINKDVAQADTYATFAKTMAESAREAENNAASAKETAANAANRAEAAAGSIQADAAKAKAEADRAEAAANGVAKSAEDAAGAAARAEAAAGTAATNAGKATEAAEETAAALEEAREIVGDVGNIEAVLDNIIAEQEAIKAIQNALIGGGSV